MNNQLEKRSDNQVNNRFEEDNITEDKSHTINKGNENQDIRFNKDKNREEINKSTSENQLR